MSLTVPIIAIYVQAVIKMESDGSFILKNLGKSIISVNGKEVGTGQFLSLSSSCLIEVYYSQLPIFDDCYDIFILFDDFQNLFFI